MRINQRLDLSRLCTHTGQVLWGLGKSSTQWSGLQPPAQSLTHLELGPKQKAGLRG